MSHINNIRKEELMNVTIPSNHKFVGIAVNQCPYPVMKRERKIYQYEDILYSRFIGGYLILTNPQLKVKNVTNDMKHKYYLLNGLYYYGILQNQSPDFKKEIDLFNYMKD